MAAVQKNGRDWFLVAADVGTRSNMECSANVIGEVAAGRMQAVPGKRTYVQKQRKPLHAPAPAADRKSTRTTRTGATRCCPKAPPLPPPPPSAVSSSTSTMIFIELIRLKRKGRAIGRHGRQASRRRALY